MESLDFTEEAASDIWDDSANNIQVSLNPQANLKSIKHYMMRINYIREQIQMQLIKLHKISSLDSHSDIFTKALLLMKIFVHFMLLMEMFMVQVRLIDILVKIFYK